MLDAKKILDSFLGSGGALGGFGGPQSGGSYGGGQRGGGYDRDQYGEQRYDERQSRGGGDLASQIGGALSKIGGGGAAQTGGASSGGLGGGLGGLAGGALAGTLASIFLGGKKRSQPIGGSAMKLGGLAILGGLAYKAWQNYQESQNAPAGQAPINPPQPQAGPVKLTPPPQETAFSPSTSAEEQRLGLLLVRAMIAAARADGHIDGAEIAKIREALKAADADGDEQAFLIEHLGRADDLDAIAAEARGPELASEVWLAARLTIEPDAPAEQQFLQTFADKLGLGEPLVAHLEATAAQAKQSGVEAR